MTMPRGERSAEHGFTLVELMTVVAIISCLASVAVAEFSRSQMRSKAAERAGIMEAIAAGVNDVVAHGQSVPDDNFAGAWNPVGVPGNVKRSFDWTLAGWNRIPLVVKGNTYYSYSFLALDPDPRGTSVTLTVSAQGDLDQDGDLSTKQNSYVASGYVFTLASQTVDDRKF